jgi:hypothetical protein
MKQSTPKMRNFAERLIAYEARGNSSPEAKKTVPFLVCEKLRAPLAALMGSGGFRGLLSRALALANAEVKWLRVVHVKADGSLEGLDQLGTQLDADEVFEGGVVLLTRLLELLVAFIGEGLTLRLVTEVWPKLFVDIR